jgi:hypothetical protein
MRSACVCVLSISDMQFDCVHYQTVVML